MFGTTIAEVTAKAAKKASIVNFLSILSPSFKGIIAQKTFLKNFLKTQFLWYKTGMNQKDVLKKACLRHELSREEIIFLLENADGELFSAADEQRKKHVGDEVRLRGLIEFSNICARTCKYCGLRGENGKLDRYRLSADEIIAFAKEGVRLGYRTIVLQSGEDPFFSRNLVVKIVSEIKKFDVALTLSIGERPFEDYKAFKDAGADRYLLRIETTDKNLYAAMHPGMSLENRIRCLRDLKKLGFETGSGCLVGLPGQTTDSLADDLLFLKNLDIDMSGIGPFIPNPDTPLAEAVSPFDNFEMSLKVTAVARLLMPDINIPATTATESLRPDGRMIALKSGANVVMPNITQGEYLKKYEIYPGKICTGEEPAQCVNCITAKILAAGRKIASDKGSRFKRGD